MRFYNRSGEIAKLLEISVNSGKNAQFTVVTGRRRIGKTQLLLNVPYKHPYLYFFVSRKAEPFLCRDFIQEIQDKLNIPLMGDVSSFSKIFEYLMEYSSKNTFTLIIDEFQDFLTINPSIYNEMQKHWDLLKSKSKINLIVCGSIYSIMHKIFKDYKAPLFGRATSFMQVHPFNVSVIKEIENELHPKNNKEDLLALYTFTGGVPKYIQLLADNNSLKFNKMIDYIISDDSPFILDGKNMLIDEFGRDYSIYFTILSGIASGYNTRSQIESLTGKEVGGYLTRLEHDYALIKKTYPIFSKNETKNVRYIVIDNYFTFWFRFIYKYSHIIEIKQYDELKRIIERDYKTFSGIILERYFRDKFIEKGSITQIGSYWDRSGENEIDLIAINETDKIAQIAEIKRNEENISLNKLKEKTYNLINKNKFLNEYNIEYLELSMKDM